MRTSYTLDALPSRKRSPDTSARNFHASLPFCKRHSTTRPTQFAGTALENSQPQRSDSRPGRDPAADPNGRLPESHGYLVRQDNRVIKHIAKNAVCRVFASESIVFRGVWQGLAGYYSRMTTRAANSMKSAGLRADLAQIELALDIVGYIPHNRFARNLLHFDASMFERHLPYLASLDEGEYQAYAS